MVRSYPLATSAATAQPGAYYPGGGISGIMLGGLDVTAALQGGQIGANVMLRDKTLPTYQGELDEFAQNLASRFSASGLPLFSDATGAVPAGGGVPAQTGYVGFAAQIQVNPTVAANPAAVRDGFPSANPTGIAGFPAIINGVLDNVLGNAPLPGTHTAGLGPTGALSASYATPATLADFATTLVGAQSADSAAASARLGTEQAVQTTLQGKLTAETGVNMDTEMSNMIALQNAYGANAKVIGTVQSMYTALLGMVNG